MPPSPSSTIWVQFFRVVNLWAMRRMVRSVLRDSIACITACSVSLSRALVASSKIMTSACL